MVRGGEGGFFEFRLEMRNNVWPFLGLFRAFHNITILGGGGEGSSTSSDFYRGKLNVDPSLSYITDVDRSCLTVGTELSTDAKTLPSTILSKVRFFY